MSELRADTITGSDGTSPVTLTKQSAAKTVVNFQGNGTAVLNGSPLNASSLVDRGTGLYTVNYTNSFSDTNYTTASHIRDGGGENDVRVVCTSDDSGTYTTGLIKLIAGYHNASTNGAIILDDGTSITFIQHGDLA